MAVTLSTGDSHYWPIYSRNTTTRNNPYASLPSLWFPRSLHIRWNPHLPPRCNCDRRWDRFHCISPLDHPLGSDLDSGICPCWLVLNRHLVSCWNNDYLIVNVVLFPGNAPELDRIKWIMDVDVVGSMTRPPTSNITLESTVDNSMVGLKMQPLVLNLTRSVLSG
ncbi:unnamed protein product [Eruca vesicaria subsp. sativa]|uniref:Uncharacterized protein n=1 Tax=Eruca vesicaria subsp. sativa TaxID=29727 RepID=A0ABC8M6G6_ERUVS|nr:unnamed protein product [Eruca vesicaria subsp. sativa]